MQHNQLAAVALAAAMVLAGCGFVTGDEALEFDASPATVSEDALSDTGYEQASLDRQVVTRNFSAAGQERTVQVTNQLARYERAVDLGPLGSQRGAVFVALASPEVSVAGQTFNPIGDMSEREILAQFESEYEGITVGDRVDNRTVSVLGESTAVERFEGTARLAGQDVDVYIEATRVQHEGDFVVAVGIYPQRLDGERENVRTLLRGLEHEGDG